MPKRKTTPGRRPKPVDVDDTESFVDTPPVDDATWVNLMTPRLRSHEDIEKGFVEKIAEIEEKYGNISDDSIATVYKVADEWKPKNKNKVKSGNKENRSAKPPSSRHKSKSGRDPVGPRHRNDFVSPAALAISSRAQAEFELSCCDEDFLTFSRTESSTSSKKDRASPFKVPTTLPVSAKKSSARYRAKPLENEEVSVTSNEESHYEVCGKSCTTSANNRQGAVKDFQKEPKKLAPVSGEVSSPRKRVKPLNTQLPSTFNETSLSPVVLLSEPRRSLLLKSEKTTKEKISRGSPALKVRRLKTTFLGSVSSANESSASTPFQCDTSNQSKPAVEISFEPTDKVTGNECPSIVESTLADDVDPPPLFSIDKSPSEVSPPILAGGPSPLFPRSQHSPKSNPIEVSGRKNDSLEENESFFQDSSVTPAMKEFFSTFKKFRSEIATMRLEKERVAAELVESRRVSMSQMAAARDVETKLRQELEAKEFSLTKMRKELSEEQRKKKESDERARQSEEKIKRLVEEKEDVEASLKHRLTVRERIVNEVVTAFRKDMNILRAMAAKGWNFVEELEERISEMD